MDSLPKIRALNDAVRTGSGGCVCLSTGIAALPSEEQAEIMRRVQNFAAFTPDNDPRGEHDFGSFEYAGKTIFWKIDYYDLLLKSGSPDPADQWVTTRVLVVTLAEEY